MNIFEFFHNCSIFIIYKNQTIMNTKTFKTIRKGDKFVKQYLFGGRIHIVAYIVLECHKKDNYILATDGLGDVYEFTEYDFKY